MSSVPADLVSRLRSKAHEFIAPSIIDQAADEIERLRAENDRLMNANRILQMRDDYVTACLV